MSFDHAKIAITARLTAYMRGFSDIPFAAEAAELVQARAAFDQLLRDGHLSPDDLTWYAPILEARSKSIDEMIRRSGVCQVLELAGGLSLRGLTMSAIPNMLYVETDLPEMIAEKAALLSEISRRNQIHRWANLHLVAADVLDRAQVLAAATRFHDGQPVAVVHEGLLQYLTATEMETVAQNIHDVLEKYGGVWITPDFPLKADTENVSPQQLRFRRIVAAATDRTMYNNAFNDVEHVVAYFGSRGFQVEVFSQSYLAPTLVSPDRVRLRPGFWEELKPKLRLWVLKCRSTAASLPASQTG